MAARSGVVPVAETRRRSKKNNVGFFFGIFNRVLGLGLYEVKVRNMSDGIQITIPADRTESGERETFYVSDDQAISIAARIVEGSATEIINGNEDFYDDPDTRRSLQREALSKIKAELTWI